MPNVIDVLRWANRREVAREITRRGYRVSGETLNRWVRERAEVPAVVEHIVFDLFGIGQASNERPAWVDGALEEAVDQVKALLSGVLSPEQIEESAQRVQAFRAERQRRADAALAPTPPRRGTARASGQR